MEDGKDPVVFPSAIFHSTLGRTFSAAYCMSTAAIDRVVAAIESAADEAVAFTQELIRVPTVNPPGEAYEECARLIGERLAQCRFQVEYFPAEGRPEHTSRHPRINVVGTRPGQWARPMV